MKKEFKEVANFYVGCKVKVVNERYVDNGYTGTIKGYLHDENELLVEHDNGGDSWEDIADCKPILKHLSDITEEETGVLFDIPEETEIYRNKSSEKGLWFDIKWKTPSGDYNYGGVGMSLMPMDKLNVYKTAYLLSKGYDLFNLIENGFAINTKSLTNPPQ